MEITKALIECLEKSPIILSEFVKHIPPDIQKKNRRSGKWSIHENVCHLAQAEIMINDRFDRIEKELKPVFNPYLPGDTVSDSDLINLDLHEQLRGFSSLRRKTVELLKSYDDSTWEKPAEHPQYYEYNALILLRHTLMHDHFHMYRIEELWLTKSEFL